MDDVKLIVYTQHEEKPQGYFLWEVLFAVEEKAMVWKLEDPAFSPISITA